MNILRFSIIVLPVLLLGACATISSSLPGSSQTGSGIGNVFAPGISKNGKEPVSAYGDFLAGRYASSESDVRSAATYFSKALAIDPGNDELHQRAMLSALYAGDGQKAGLLAREILAKDSANRLAILFAANDLIARKKYREAKVYLEEAPLGPMNGIAGKLMLAWAYQGLGDTDSAISLLDELQSAPALGDMAIIHKGLVQWQNGQTGSARKTLEKAYATELLANRTAFALATLYMREDDFQAARKLIAQRLARNGDELEAVYLFEFAQKERNTPEPFDTPAKALAEGLAGLGQAWAGRSLYDLAVLYLEMALQLDNEHDGASSLLAKLYELQQRETDAIVRYRAIRPQSPWYGASQLDLSRVLFRQEKNAAAIRVLQNLVAKQPTRTHRLALSEALQFDKQYARAFDLVDALIKEDPKAADWRLYFARAVCLERTDRWREGVADFRKSLEMEPEQADVLNYLGYTFVDNQENVEEGFALIRQAIKLSPKAGYIVDSLGWGHYRRGEFELAVQELERAVEMEPGEPAINDHLGDAYWQVGRKLEARFQWQHVLALEADDEVDLELVQNKIKNGLSEPGETQLAVQ